MAFPGKCPKCSLDLIDASSATCPSCGTPLLVLPSSSSRTWLAVLVQIAFMGTFMFFFHFPKGMIAVFVVVILLFAALSARMKSNAGMPRPPVPQRPLSHPVLFRIVSLAIALCAIVFVSSLLFGFVAFLNSWNHWHQYEGQPYHRSDFVVKQAYFQKGNKGAVYVYASGTVEGQREWMNLFPYLQVKPRSEAELHSMIGPGDTIPILLFTKLEGRARVQFDDGINPADAGRHDAMNALKYGAIGLAISSILIFFLNRLRQLCYAPTDRALAFNAASSR